MKQCNHGIAGLQSGLSPSAPPFAIASSSVAFTASKSENEDPIWGDYTLDLSFLSSDDQRSCFFDDDDSLSNLSRDVDTTKGVDFAEGQLLEEKIACSGDVIINPNPLPSRSPELLIMPSNVFGDDKLELSSANTTLMSEKSLTGSEQDDSEEDSPCWIGINPPEQASGAKVVTSRLSMDDLSGFHRLNPLAPQFIPSISKKNHDTDRNKYEENASSSSLKKSMSSSFPSSSGEFNLTDPPGDGGNDAARRTSILTHVAGDSFDFLSQDTVSKSLRMSSKSLNEFQQSQRLDPLAPVFVPSSTKVSPSVHEMQGAFETNAHSAFAPTSSDIKPRNKVNVVACSEEVDNSFKNWYGIHESKVGITEYAKFGSSSNKSHGQRRLNPLAPHFSLPDTKPKAYGYEKNKAADELSLVVNTTGLPPPYGYWEHNVGEAGLARSSVHMECLLPNTSCESSSLISPKGDSNFGPSKWFAVEPRTTLSVKGNKDFKHPSPFHVIETVASSSSSDLKAFSGASPKIDVKKLLTTMHGLSELLTLAHGSESSDSPNEEVLNLINSTVHNLNLYSQNTIREQAADQSVAGRSPYDLKLLPNKSKLSIRDLQLPTANNMTVNLDVKRKDKYSMVSEDSHLCEYGATKDNNFGQIVAKSGYQQNHQGDEQVNPRALFYKSLWLKAEAERCLVVYETSLSNPTS